MFFLLIHFIVKNPNFISQLIMGCVCYVILFFIMKDFVSNKSFQEYKYYIGSLLIIDILFLIYNHHVSKKKVDSQIEHIIPLMQETNSSIESNPNSESNDIRIIHDMSITIDDNLEFLQSSDKKHNDVLNSDSKLNDIYLFSSEKSNTDNTLTSLHLS
uniref:Uncharacterized protein n=1 Tax=viral metagenome TaxID=1070528 RepID=A0A6C0LV12_9ZZZZ